MLKNLISLLKPGGYLQWMEPLPLLVKAVHPAPGMGDPAMDRLAAQWHKPTDTSTYNWTEGLPQAYREQGLEIVAVDRTPISERYRYFWGHSQLAGLEDIAADVNLLGVEHSEALKKWTVQLNKAFSNGSYIDTLFTCVIGRKAKL